MDLTVIGMISGTSYDAVDAAVARLSLHGEEVVLEPLGLHSQDIPPRLREAIATSLPPHPTSFEAVCRLDTELGQLFGEVAAQADSELAGGSADLVVSHGQTVFHWVEGSRALGTLQLGSAAWVAARTGLPVVSDLRSRDLTVGGQGAPLASTLDTLLLLGDGVRRGALNLGGISNLTLRGEGCDDGGDGQVLAYDIGPASALMDAAVTQATRGVERMDTGGARAARGSVDSALLGALLAEPYYRLPAPKSTGKELFHARYVEEVMARSHTPGSSPTLSTDDLLATLTELTARLVAEAATRYRLDELVAAGGGVRNPVLMARIAELAPGTRVRPMEDFGLPAQAKEAYLFALLGYLSVHGLPGTIASATGAQAASVLGSITPGARALRLPEPAEMIPTRLRVQAP